MNLDKFKIDFKWNVVNDCSIYTLKKYDEIVFECDDIIKPFSNFFDDYQPILKIYDKDVECYYDLRSEVFIKIETIQDAVRILNESKQNNITDKYKTLVINDLYYLFDCSNNLVSDIGYDDIDLYYLNQNIVELKTLNDYYYYDIIDEIFFDLSIDECITYLKKDILATFNYKNKHVLIKNSEFLKIYDYADQLSSIYIFAQNIEENLEIYDTLSFDKYQPNIKIPVDELKFFCGGFCYYNQTLKLNIISLDYGDIAYVFDTDFNFIIKLKKENKHYNSFDSDGFVYEDFSNYIDANKLISDYVEYINMMKNISTLI